jgi:hypothetical protein
MRYQVALIVSPAKGCLARLFSLKGRHAKGVLEIEPDNQRVVVYGTDPLVSGIRRELSFDEIDHVESKGPMLVDIYPKAGKPIMLKNVDEVAAILDTLGAHVQDTTHELVRRRVDKFEARVNKRTG